MTDTFTQRVIAVVARVKNVAPESISPSTTLDELGVDSLDAVSIVFDLEAEFNIEIEPAEAAAAASVSDLVEGVRRLTAADGGERIAVTA